MASAALDEVFISNAPDHAVFIELPVTKIWLRQLTLGLGLICRGSYRGVVDLMRDLLGVSISEGKRAQRASSGNAAGRLNQP